MTDLEKQSKKELVEMVVQLRQKLLDLQGVEAKQVAVEKEMPGVGFSVVQDVDDRFKIVEIAFDFNSKAAIIKNVSETTTNGYEYALYEAKKFLVEHVMNKDNLNHLKEKKNG